MINIWRHVLNGPSNDWDEFLVNPCHLLYRARLNSGRFNPCTGIIQACVSIASGWMY